MDKTRGRIVEDCQGRLWDYYKHEKNGAKWRVDLQKSKNKLQDDARQIANDLLREKEKEAGENENITLQFTAVKIEEKFQKFQIPVKNKFSSEKETAFHPMKVRQEFANEIGLRYGHVSDFTKVSNNFGVHMEKKFKHNWVKLSHIEFTGDLLDRIYRECKICGN